MNRYILTMLVFLSLGAVGNEYTIEDIQFQSHSVYLSGSIVFPTEDTAHSAVVFVHGSGPQERNLYWAKQFASQGIIALVYDKRGVGHSGGMYEAKQSVSEKNISLLADDAAAAFGYLQQHVKTANKPLGLVGISQAGWIVPLAAASGIDADFLVLWSGPVCKVSEEDIYSKYTRDSDHQQVPSYEEALSSRKRKYIWPDFLGKDIDSRESLAKLNIPGLWIYGQQDGSVPVDLSIQGLDALISNGHKYEYVLFSKLGHNNMVESFTTATDWIRRL